jgi:hypothetical protein
MALAKGLLDLGRAAIDLGDDAYRNLLRLIEAGYPDTTAMKIVTGELPMDNASRMARATEQGKTDLAYHVSNDAMNEGPNGMEFTDKGILSFTPEGGRGTWFSGEQPYLSQSYAIGGDVSPPASYPVLIDTRGMERTSAMAPDWNDYKGSAQHWSGIRDPRVFRPDGREVMDSSNVPIYDNETLTTDRLSQESYERGADGIVIDNVIDIGPRAGRINQSLTRMGIDPKEWMEEYSKSGGQVISMHDGSRARSLHGAAFDPDQVNTNNLLATNPAATSLAGLLSLLGISEADGLLSNNRYD